MNGPKVLGSFFIGVADAFYRMVEINIIILMKTNVGV